MIFTRDFVTRENHCRIASLVTKKSLFTVTHALFFISCSYPNEGTIKLNFYQIWIAMGKICQLDSPNMHYYLRSTCIWPFYLHTGNSHTEVSIELVILNQNLSLYRISCVCCLMWAEIPSLPSWLGGISAMDMLQHSMGQKWHEVPTMKHN